ncbi:MAG: pyruvate, phosphate dikinase, partial [Candidatus Thermoplasmatota archaeon]|nr:pyruvate, phosphate dikinase [Candidatus Thermoplasmatota archaeon]
QEGKFMSKYLEEKIVNDDPFRTIDAEGVGELMKMAVERGRKGKKSLEIGICGEQGGDPETIEFCHRIGLDYVSASPFRIPIARLSAARAALSGRKK